MKHEKVRKLALSLVIAALAIAGLGYSLGHATTADQDYSIVLEGPNAPAAQRAAPYGQWIITHNGVSITSTQNLGTVARTNGYDPFKAIICETGTYVVTGTLYARTTSTGNLYTITTNIVFPANTRTITTTQGQQISPWMSLGLTSMVTGSSTTCGIYVQTP